MENAYLQLPVEADCSNDHVPVLGQHKAKVMDGGITMTKYLFSHYRLTLYSFLNQALLRRSGPFQYFGPHDAGAGVPSVG